MKRESVTEVVDGEGVVRVSLMKMRTQTVQVSRQKEMKVAYV